MLHISNYLLADVLSIQQAFGISIVPRMHCWKLSSNIFSLLSLQNGNKTYTTGSYFMFEEVQIYYYFLKLISSFFCLFIYI